MAEQDYGRAMDLEVYIQAQGAGGYQTPKYVPVPADAIPAIDFALPPDIPLTAYQRRTGRQGRIGTIVGMESGSWRYTAELIPSGSAGTGPDDELMWLTGGWYGQDTPAAGTTISGDWAAYNSGDLASAVNVTEDSTVLGFEDSSGNIYARLVIGVAGSTISIHPPLPFTPSDGDTVHVGTSYEPAVANDERAFSAWVYGTHDLRAPFGCYPDTHRMSWGGNDSPRHEISGQYRGLRWASPTTIDEGATFLLADTTLTVADPRKVSDGIVIEIESEDLLVARKEDDGDLIVTRAYNGSSAADHADGTDVTIFKPSSQSLSGDPLGPADITVDIGSGNTASTRYESESGSLERSGGVAPRERGHGDQYRIQGINLSMDESITVTVTTWAKKGDVGYLQDTRDGTEYGLVVQAGDTAGKILGYIVTRAVPEAIDIKTEGETHIGAELSFTGREGKAGHKSIYYFAL